MALSSSSLLLSPLLATLLESESSEESSLEVSVVLLLLLLLLLLPTPLRSRSLPSLASPSFFSEEPSQAPFLFACITPPLSSCLKMHLSPFLHVPLLDQKLHTRSFFGVSSSSTGRANRHALTSYFALEQKKKYFPSARELSPPSWERFTFFSLDGMPQKQAGGLTFCISLARSMSSGDGSTPATGMCSDFLLRFLLAVFKEHC